MATCRAEVPLLNATHAAPPERRKVALELRRPPGRGRTRRVERARYRGVQFGPQGPDLRGQVKIGYFHLEEFLSGQRPGGIARHDGARRDVPGHDAAGADDGALADGDAAEDRRPGADGGALLDAGRLTFQSASVCSEPSGFAARGTLVVDERDVVADEDLVLDLDALADERVARDLAVPPDPRVPLDLDEAPTFVLSPISQP